MNKLKYIIVFFVLVFLGACSNGTSEEIVLYSLKETQYNAVINHSLADIYEDSSIDSKRMTQAVYNQPVWIIDQKGDYFHIRTLGNIEGYVLVNKVSYSTSSLETNEKDQKILVTGKTKTIYSKTDGKIPIEEVVTGTILSYRGKVGDWVRVQMCEGEYGYITINNIILFQDHIPITSVDSFVRDIISFSGGKYMQGGISELEGFDMSNLIYVCAKINGYELPIDIFELKGTYDGISVENIRAGDILFLAKDRYNEYIQSVAVVVDNSQVIMFSDEDLEIGIYRMADHDIMNRIRKTVRIFEENE